VPGTNARLIGRYPLFLGLVNKKNNKHHKKHCNYLEVRIRQKRRRLLPINRQNPLNDARASDPMAIQFAGSDFVKSKAA
jgi:hypothetical protein